MKSSLFLQRCSMEMQTDPPHVPTFFSGVICLMETTRDLRHTSQSKFALLAYLSRLRRVYAVQFHRKVHPLRLCRLMWCLCTRLVQVIAACGLARVLRRRTRWLVCGVLQSAKRPRMLGTLICDNSAFTVRGAACTAYEEDNKAWGDC